jgi:hypothetical protein
VLTSSNKPITAAPGTYNFKVCAIDLNGSQVCIPVTIVITGGTVTDTWAGTFTGMDGLYCYTSSGRLNFESTVNGTLTLQFPAPGLVAMLTTTGGRLSGGSFSTTESPVPSSCSTFNPPTQSSGPIVTGANNPPGFITAVGANPPTIWLASGAQNILPESGFFQITLTPTTITATTVSGSWTVCAGCTNTEGTFQFTKQ